MPKQPRGSKVPSPQGRRSSRRQCSDLSTTPPKSLFPEVVMENPFTPTKNDLQHLDKVCRLCMVRGGPAMEHIFENSSSTSIAAQITWVTQLELRREDPLPSRICQQCIFRLQLSQNFKQQCITSDKTLRDLYLTQNPRDEGGIASSSQATAVIGANDEEEVDADQMNAGYSLKVEPLSPCCQDDEDQDFKIEIVEHSLVEPGSSGSKARNTRGGTAPFVCEDCHRIYPTWDQLRRHRVYHSEKRIPCPEPGCERKFLRRAQLRRHLLWHSGEKPFACAECDKKFAAQTTLDVHMRLHTGEKSFKCHLCEKTFGHNSTLTTHVRGHLGDRPYQCPTCPLSFTAKSPLNKHIRTHTGLKPHKCPDCHLTFTLPGSLRAHARTHTGERPYLCPHCDKCFTQPGGLKNHVRIHTGSKPYECKICNKSYRQQGAYGIHMRTHFNIKPYSCDVCSKSFNVKKTLARHIRVHTGEKEFECSVCHQAFLREDGLATHMFIHSKQKPFHCVDCNKGFRQKVALVLHMRCHTGERPYKCDYCSMTFAQKGTMTTHMRVHTGEKPFDCSQCEKTFAQLGNLIHHKKRHHPYGKDDAKGEETIRDILDMTEEHEEKVKKEDLFYDSDVGEPVDNAGGEDNLDKPMQCQLCSKTFLKLKTLIWHVERFHSFADELRTKNKKTKKAKTKKVCSGAASEENVASTEIITMKTDDKSEIKDETAAKQTSSNSSNVTNDSTNGIGLITNELTDVDQSNLTPGTIPDRGVSTNIPTSQTEVTENLDAPSVDLLAIERSSAEVMDVVAQDRELETADPHESFWLLPDEALLTNNDCVEHRSTPTSHGSSNNNGNDMPTTYQCVKSSTSDLELVKSIPGDIFGTTYLSSKNVNLNPVDSEILVENNFLHPDFISNNLKSSASSVAEKIEDASEVIKGNCSEMETNNTEPSLG